MNCFRIAHNMANNSYLALSVYKKTPRAECFKVNKNSAFSRC